MYKYEMKSSWLTQEGNNLAVLISSERWVEQLHEYLE